MDTPRVLILSHSDFHRRLMSDVVACNDMCPVASTGGFLEELEARRGRQDVVVVDFEHARDGEGLATVERLAAWPAAARPRVVVLVDDASAADLPASGALLEADLLQGPLDVGSFARVVARHASESVLASS